MILTVFHPGPDFSVKHVMRLYKQVRQNCPASVPFRCLTRERFTEPGIEIIPMSHMWPDYWCKIELFTIPGPCLYLDLDTTILGDLQPFLEASTKHEFIALKRNKEHQPGVQSSIMGWSGDMTRLYNRFKPKVHIPVYQDRTRGGGRMFDEGFILDHWDGSTTLWQIILPGMALSYKRGWLAGAPRQDCRLVYFQAKPRPWHIAELN